MMNNINIYSVTEENQEEVISFVLASRRNLFPMLDHTIIPRDLQAFSSTYIHTDLGAFLQARTDAGSLIGVIAMMRYDYRFPYLDINEGRAVELARLYVDPDYRKAGVGRALVEGIKVLAERQAVETLYLHTHPFLEGAFTFWKKQGFRLLISCQESGFETWHMIF